MDFYTQPDKGRHNSVKVSKNTKIFKGLKSKEEAKKYAEENKSYIFVVLSDNKISKDKTVREFYGFGVSK